MLNNKTKNFIRKNTTFFNQKGAVAILMSLIVLSVMFIIATSVALVRKSEIQFASSIYESTIAYQAADNGLEYALGQLKIDPTGNTITGLCPNKVIVGEGKYCLEITRTGINVSTLKSIGESSKVKRAVEVSFGAGGVDPVLFVKADGIDGSQTFVDSSLTPHTLEAKGNTQIDTSTSVAGGSSMLFDGDGDYIEIPDSDDFKFKTEAFTIDTWIYVKDTSLGNHILHKGADISGITDGYEFRVDTNGALRFQLMNNFSITGSVVSPSSTIVDSQWQHVAVVKDGVAVKLYVDGVAKGSTILNGPYNGGSEPVRIGGKNKNNEWWWFDGNIDNFRITKGRAFTEEEIKDAYDSVVTDTVLLVKADGDFTDSSPTPHVLTSNGAQIDTSKSVAGGSSMKFDGSGEYVETPYSDDWNFGSGDFTIDTWVYPTSNPNTITGLLGLGASGGSDSFIYTKHSASGGNIQASMRDTGGVTYIYTTTPIALNAWQYITLVRNGNDLNLYLDGVLIGSEDVTGKTMVASDNKLTIGKDDDAGVWPFFGNVDELRIIKGRALTEVEIKDMYNSVLFSLSSSTPDYNNFVYDVEVDTNFVSNFNFGIDEATVDNSTICISKNELASAGCSEAIVSSISVLGGKITIDPNDNLNYETTYYSHITTDLKDVNGNNLASNFVSSGFQTELPLCGEYSVTYEGGPNSGAYSTIEVAGQCWLGENLNVGTMLASAGAEPADNGIVEKWCYSTSNDCNTYGGLYRWNEAMGYVETSGVQGICPSGWHIPTDGEQNALDQFYATGSCNAGRDRGDCSPAGVALQVGGASGFDILLGGIRIPGSFLYKGSKAALWSSSVFNTNTALSRMFNQSDGDVYRSSQLKTYGFGVRCIRGQGE